jgi:NAD(P)-dependent dehydrogenase (short-subunit alcohol dehydrogenase family)
MLSRQVSSRRRFGTDCPRSRARPFSLPKALPVGKVGDPADIAEAYLFLMRSTFTTGQAVVVEDGMLLVSVWAKAVNGHSIGRLTGSDGRHTRAINIT